MAYDPMLYMPYDIRRQQPVDGVVVIDGVEGAQMYQLPPDSVSPPLFLRGEDSFIIKTTDGGGASTLKKYSFSEEPLTSGDGSELYVTKEHFDSWANQIMEAINGQHTASEHPEPEGEQ